MVRLDHSYKGAYMSDIKEIQRAVNTLSSLLGKKADVHWEQEQCGHKASFNKMMHNATLDVQWEVNKIRGMVKKLDVKPISF